MRLEHPDSEVSEPISGAYMLDTLRARIRQAKVACEAADYADRADWAALEEAVTRACLASGGSVHDVPDARPGAADKACRLPKQVSSATPSEACGTLEEMAKEAHALLAEGQGMSRLRSRTDQVSRDRCLEKVPGLRTRLDAYRQCVNGRGGDEWWSLVRAVPSISGCIDCSPGSANRIGSGDWSCAQAAAILDPKQ